MERESYIIRTPGKLSLLGEYAVLEKNAPAVVAAINKYLYCNINTLEDGKITFRSSRIGIPLIEYEYGYRKLRLLSDFQNLDLLVFSKNALEITLRFLEEKGNKIKGFEINVLSDLNSRSGEKYGFGSSAALTVALVAGVLYLHGYEINKEKNREAIFKLSAIAHFLSQGSGSGLDIAASVYGGVFIYKSFNSDWLKLKLKQMNFVSELVKENWPFFYYEKILVLMDFFLCVGWTGKSASTKNFLEKVKLIKNTTDPEIIAFYKKFLRLSGNLVEMFKHGIKEGKRELIDNALILNRNLLLDLSSHSGVTMETEKLKYLIAIAKKLGFSAKFSGAGGGDCGYAVVYDRKSRLLIKEAWKKYDIEMIDTEIDDSGVCSVEFLVNEETP